MARPVRVEYANAVYHLTARGNERKAIYRDDQDRTRFLETLEETRQRFGLVVHGFCLMANHYHLLAQTPRANLSAAAAWLQTTYSVRFNRRHRRSGHLFQGRFKAHLVEEDVYARELIKYIHLNPVRPRDKRKAVPPERKRALAVYRWSSHRAYAGRERSAVFPGLCLDRLSYFGRTRRAAQVEYRRQIEQMFGQVVPSPWEDLRQGLVLGGEALWAKARKLLSGREGQEEIRWQRHAEAHDISRVIASLVEEEADRRVAIWMRVRLGGERMTEIARQYGYKDGSGVHQVVKRLEKKAQCDRALSAHLQTLADAMSSVKS
jgi:putative transposase